MRDPFPDPPASMLRHRNGCKRGPIEGTIGHEDDCRTAMNKPDHPRRKGASMPLPDTVALVLQGGGALGSYQAGVVDRLADHEIEIDWIAGISIGAINGAIIAGNPPERR